MTTHDDTQRRDALAQLDATLAAMHRLREAATMLAHGLEQSKEALAHGGDALWSTAPEKTSELAWQIARRNAVDAIAAADELKPAAAGKAMPAKEAADAGKAA